MLIKITDVCKKYNTKLSIIKSNNEYINAVNNVTFSVDKNEIIGLVGESGCGKSTLSRLIMRLEEPSKGNIEYENKNIWDYKGKDLKRFRRECQIIFQDTLTSLNPNLKIIDCLMEPLNNHFNISKDDKILKIKEMLKFVDLKDNVLNKYPRDISGGERQRVNICRALILKPKFLICDEITSSLDVCTQASILNMIKQLNDISNAGILFISHDISAVKYLCSKILVMYKGNIVEVIDNKNPLYKIKHEYTRKLMDSIPINNPNKRKII